MEDFDIDALKSAAGEAKIVIVKDSLTELEDETLSKVDEVINNQASRDLLRLIIEKFI
jgi:hypothetical protein